MKEVGFTAEREIYAVAPNGRGFEIQLAIGKPYRVAEDEWACAVQLLGLHDRLSDMHGVDSWQALQLAQQLVAQLLGSFVQDGGRLYFEKDGKQLQISELFAKVAAF